jgi:cytochrome P450
MIPKGQLVVIDIAATNRDPSKFDEPTDISFTKNRHRNLSFGAGMHKCIGMGIARTQLRVFLDYFLDKTQHLTIENIKWTRNRGFGVDYSDFINVRSTPKDQDNDNGPRCPFGFSKSA